MNKNDILALSASHMVLYKLARRLAEDAGHDPTLVDEVYDDTMNDVLSELDPAITVDAFESNMLDRFGETND